MDQVYPELDYALPNDIIAEGGIEVVAFDIGRIRGGQRRPNCLDHANPDSRDGVALGTFPCHGQGGAQFFIYTKLHEIRHSSDKEMCLTHNQITNSAGQDVDVAFMSRYVCHICHTMNNPYFSCVGHLRLNKSASPGQYWIFEDSGRIYNPTAHLCVAISGRDLILKAYFF